MFPVGNIDLYFSDYASAKDKVDIDLFAEDGTKVEPVADLQATNSDGVQTDAEPITQAIVPVPVENENDFEITAEELAGIEFVPTAQRMQTVDHSGTTKVKVNFKTVLQKGILWALIGALIGFGIGELLDGATNNEKTASLLGYSHLSKYYSYTEKASEELKEATDEFEAYCKANNIDPNGSKSFENWFSGNSISADAEKHLENYLDYDSKAEDALYDAYQYDFGEDEDDLGEGMKKTSRVSTGLWSAIIALFVGLFLGIGEGVFYGSKEKAVKYGAIGAAISVVLGFFSGYLAQWMYSALLGDDPSLFLSSLIRGLGWAVMGIGIGAAIGLIRPEKKRILFCGVGGLAGAFIGGFVFNYVCKIIPNDIVARATAIVIMGGLIGVGVGLLEQFAKQAWLKVIRGEFEGKEYLVFAGTTSIGNNGKNTIVLFKDKLVGPHHCDIVLEGSKYVVVDCGTPMGTIVNGRKISRQILKQGDAIAIGNSVLVFNTK